jgi:outer membrane protein
MKRILFATIIWLSITGLVPAAFCADAVKIGVIDFERIMKESSAGKMSQKTLNTKGAELKGKLEKEKQRLDEIGQAFEKEALVLRNGNGSFEIRWKTSESCSKIMPMN